MKSTHFLQGPVKEEERAKCFLRIMKMMILYSSTWAWYASRYNIMTFSFPVIE
jgi:hypothetical protein